MNLNQFENILTRHLKTPEYAVLVEGDPGCGKTSVPRSLAKKLGIGFWYVNTPQTDAMEVGGLPEVIDHRLSYALSEDFPVDGVGPGIMLLDEFPKAQTIVMNCYSELLQERTLRGRRLDPRVLIVATANKRSNKAGDNQMPSHINRRFTRYNVETSVKSWMPWAIDNNVDQRVRSFLNYRGDTLLSNFDPTQVNYPNPDAWVRISTFLPHFIDNPEALTDMVAGTVGDGAASDFIGFQRLFDKCPDSSVIFNDPMNAPIPDEMGILWSLMTKLADDVDKKTNEALFRYLGRYTNMAEIAAVCVSAATQRDPLISMCKSGTAWMVENSQYFVKTTR